jgi:hypothetical protein
MPISVQYQSMNTTRILRIIYINLLILFFFLVICFELSPSAMESFKNNNHRYKRASSSFLNVSNTQNDLSLKNYFTNRHCIKYSGNQQLFRFNEQSGQIDISGKLRIIVSINALNSLTNRDKEKRYKSFSLYFLIVSRLNYLITFKFKVVY